MAEVNNAVAQDLTMLRGSTFSFSFELIGLNQSVDAAFFSCKAKLEDTAYAFQKTLEDGIEEGTGQAAGIFSVRIAPEDTAELPAGRYYYDLVVDANDDRQPIMFGSLILVQGVTNPAE